MRRIWLFTSAVSMLFLASTPGLASPASAAATSAVEVLDTSGPAPVRCRDVDTGGRFVEGGCAASAHEFSADLAIRTAFGAMPFADCTISFDVTLATDGRLWIDHIRIGGQSPCNDIRPCAPPEVLAGLDDPYDILPLGRADPWKGRVRVVDGRFVARIDACFDTCVGRYEGPLELQLERGDDGWALRASRGAGVGDGGLAVEGAWELDPGRFQIRDKREGATGRDRGTAARRGDGPVARAIAGLRRALAAGRLARACALLAPAARRAVGSGAAASCPDGLRGLSTAIRSGAATGSAPEVVTSTTGPGRAAAVLRTGPGPATEVRLVKRRGRWLLTRFRVEPFDENPTTAHKARRGGLGVTALARRRRRSAKCPRIDARDRFDISGGCSGQAVAGDVDLTLVTVAGAYTLAGCALSWEVVVGPDGRTWTYDTTAGGSRHCRAIEACFRERDDGGKTGGLPMEGQIHGNGDGDGSAHQHLDLCLRTPLGRVEGSVNVRLVPGRSRVASWTVEADGAPVGRGAFRLTGRWDLAIPGLRLRERLPAGLSSLQGRLAQASAATRAPAGRQARARGVSVWDTGGRKPAPCPDYDASDSSDIRGGCRIDARGPGMRLRILSVVGDIDFAPCTFNYSLYLDADGQAALDVLVGGESPCNDVRPCTEERGEWPAAWDGQLERLPDGGLRLVADACLDTCMGIFEGELLIDLTRHGPGWRASVDRQTLGTSGWQLDGDWRLHRSRDVDVRAAAAG